MNKFPHDRGQLCKAYMGGGHDGDKGKVVDEGLSGGCGSDRPRTASSMSSRFIGIGIPGDNQACTHRIRAIQAINSRVANTRTKTVGASATKMIGVSVVYILLGMIEWGF
jgi:hypothetical protein